MREKKKSDLAMLLAYAGSYKGLTFLGLGLSAVAMVLGMLPYLCLWLVVRDLIAVAPNWTEAAGIAKYGWMAFGSAVAGIAVYFAALMCTHLAAFRTASNIRKAGMAHLMKAPLGFFDSNASGLLRNRLDGAASETETLLAHNLADIVGTIAMFLAMLVLMFLFDWRMGAACLLAAVVSVLAMGTMMGGKNARLMAEYQAAQDVMSKAGTEYVRGIPVVKVFQQTVYSFKERAHRAPGRGDSLPRRGERDKGPGGAFQVALRQDGAGHRPPHAHRRSGRSDRCSFKWQGGRKRQPGRAVCAGEQPFQAYDAAAECQRRLEHLIRRVLSLHRFRRLVYCEKPPFRFADSLVSCYLMRSGIPAGNAGISHEEE